MTYKPLRNHVYGYHVIFVLMILPSKMNHFQLLDGLMLFGNGPKHQKKLQTFKRMDSFENIDININDDKDETKENHGSGEAKLMYTYTNTEGHCIAHIADLTQSSLSYYLPLDANKIFYQPSLIKITHIEAPKLTYNQFTKMAHSEYYVKAELNEHLELFYFPFDSQFLNVKLRFNVDYFCILDYIDEKQYPIQHKFWGDVESLNSKRNIKQHHYKPVKVSLKESLLNEVTLFPVWCDFRSKKVFNNGKEFSGRYSMIRLRIARNPMFFFTNVLFPFFIIVSCSFAACVVSFGESLGDRFAVSVTILLTFTAFQNIIGEQLPETSVMLLLDYYILFAYLVQALIILETAIIAGLDDHWVSEESLEYIDNIIGGVLGGIWCIFSLFYMMLQVKCVRTCHDKCCVCFEAVGDWDKRSQREVELLTKAEKEIVGYELPKNGKPKRILTDSLREKPGVISRQHSAMVDQDNQ
eukprot:537055_1